LLQTCKIAVILLALLLIARKVMVNYNLICMSSDKEAVPTTEVAPPIGLLGKFKNALKGEVPRKKAESGGPVISRRTLLKTAGGFALGLGLNRAFGSSLMPRPLVDGAREPDTGTEVEQAQPETELTPEQLALTEQLQAVAEAWHFYQLDQQLQQTIESSTYFGNNPDVYENRGYGEQYQELFQTIDFFVDVKKLIQLYEQDSSAAIEFLQNEQNAREALLFKKIVFPMFAVLALQIDSPEEKRDDLIDAEYVAGRNSLLEMTPDEAMQKLTEDMPINPETGNYSLTLSQHYFVFNQQNNYEGFHATKLGPIIYSQGDFIHPLSPTLQGAVVASLNNMNATHPGAVSMAAFVEGYEGKGLASFSHIDATLKLNTSQGLILQLLRGTLTHEVLGHGSPSDFLQKWGYYKNTAALLDRVAHFHPKSLLSSCELQINILRQLFEKSEFVLEISTTDNRFNTHNFISAEEQAIVRSINLNDQEQIKQTRQELMQNLDEQSLSDIKNNPEVVTLLSGLPEDVVENIIKIIRQNSTNLVSLAQQLIEISKQYPEATGLSQMIGQIVFDIQHTLIDVQMHYCNEFCGIKQDPLGQSIQKFPDVVNFLTSIDPRQQAALEFFKARNQCTQPYGTELMTDQEVLLTFANSAKVMTDYYERILNQFPATKDRKITLFTDFDTLTNVTLIDLATCYDDVQYSPHLGAQEDIEYMDDQWKKVKELLPTVMQRVVEVDSTGRDDADYCLGVERIMAFLMRSEVSVNAGSFYDFCRTLPIQDPEITAQLDLATKLNELSITFFNNRSRANINQGFLSILNQNMSVIIAPLLFSYEPATQTFNKDIFTQTQPYFNSLLEKEPGSMQRLYEVADASAGVDEVLAEIKDEEFVILSQQLKLFGFAMAESQTDQALVLLKQVVASSQSIVSQTEGESSYRLQSYLGEISYYLNIVSSEETRSFINYLEYRTRFALSGILDSKSITARLEDRDENGNVIFRPIGTDPFDAKLSPWFISPSLLPAPEN